MKHRANPRFWQDFRRLPHDIQQLARECYRLLRDDPRHPSLHLKKVGRMWSVRVGIHYRAVAVEEEGALVGFWIGTHAEYDQLLRRM
ncbi:type II toxin-antitoxin system RelE family toxin [Aeoliella sp. SH292]|uniref:type II toxin-antitoxin system RelE family toxin n=1 Tax=Aeoliella sp. SH292 TaxID=3454464 RepID=UPI003F9572EF